MLIRAQYKGKIQEKSRLGKIIVYPIHNAGPQSSPNYFLYLKNIFSFV